MREQPALFPEVERIAPPPPSLPMVQRLWIPEKMPGMNQILHARGVVQRGRGSARGNAYNTMKRKWHKKIRALCLEQRIHPVEAAEFRFTWYEPDRRRDPDNISSGGRKIILDSLVAAEILPGDGWRNVRGFREEFVASSGLIGVAVEILAI
jgi:hypothetical protein